MQKPQKKKSTRTLSSLKNEAWREFSRFIRLRDCIRTTGDTDFGVCITCGKRVAYGSSQAGHFIAGRTNAILFDEDIVHLQCYACNVCNHGEQLEYYYAMKNLGYTDDDIDEMRGKRHEYCKFTAQDYEDIIEHYKEKTAKLQTVFLKNGAYSKSVISLTSLPHENGMPF